MTASLLKQFCRTSRTLPFMGMVISPYAAWGADDDPVRPTVAHDIIYVEAAALALLAVAWLLVHSGRAGGRIWRYRVFAGIIVFFAVTAAWRIAYVVDVLA